MCIHRLQATEAPDLACRWNCKAGKCGSCSAEINGKPRLMCMTRMDTLPEGPVTVAPMRTFPIIRDLVTDVSFNYEKAKEVPAFQPGPVPEGGYRMQQIDVERGQEFRKCIECFMCQDVCHVIRDHEENKTRYAGPRFFIRYAELEMHPLDTNDRRELVRQQAGLGLCNITKCCTEVCPEHIKITDNAIIPLKERVVDASYDPVGWLGRKILRRSKASPEEARPRADLGRGRGGGGSRGGVGRRPVALPCRSSTPPNGWRPSTPPSPTSTSSSVDAGPSLAVTDGGFRVAQVVHDVPDDREIREIRVVLALADGRLAMGLEPADDPSQRAGSTSPSPCPTRTPPPCPGARWTRRR